MIHTSFSVDPATVIFLSEWTKQGIADLAYGRPVQYLFLHKERLGNYSLNFFNGQRAHEVEMSIGLTCWKQHYKVMFTSRRESYGG